MPMYRTLLPALIAIGLVVAWNTTPARSQAAAPPQDSTPFARPKPLSVVPSRDPRALLTRIVKIVEDEGFTVRELNPVDGQLEAVRDDKTERGARDQVLVWLERDLAQPNDTVKVFLLYGRFMNIVGNTTGFRRIRADETMEGARIGTLRSKLIRLASGDN